MEEESKQSKQEVIEEKHSESEKTLKTVVISIICTLLFVVLLLLLVIVCLKNCANKGNSKSSLEPPLDSETNKRINDVFIDIVNKQMTFDGYDNDELLGVVVVSYIDNYPTDFNLNIIVNSDSKVYYYNAEDINYPEDKNGYDNFVSYLLKESNNHILNGNISLTSLDKVDTPINTSKTSYKGITAKTSAEDKYISGFTYEEDSFFIYQKRLIVEGNEPFSGVGDQKISSEEPLFDYYRFLLAQLTR